MQLKFPYSNGRPALTAKLRKGNNKARYFEFLIDSGADFTLISQSDALLLGIEYKSIKTKEIKVEVANLTYIHAKRTNITITIGNNNFAVPVLVAKEEVERLLGRKGVFDKFDVTFKEKSQEVIFKN